MPVYNFNTIDDQLASGAQTFASGATPADLILRGSNTSPAVAGQYQIYDIGNNVAQLVQAMAGFGGGSAAESFNTTALGADTSQQTLLTAPPQA
jgi:hypothetical protein